jgi:hypothetical protein
MNRIWILVLGLAVAFVAGCESVPQTATPMMGVADFVAKEPIAESLFPSDQAILGDEAVGRILSSKLELPAKAKLALMRFPSSIGSR